MRNQITRVFTTDITIRVNLITSFIIKTQRHRRLRHRPRGAPAQQAGKQQRHPSLHVFSLLGYSARSQGTLINRLMVYYTLSPPDFQGMSSILEVVAAFFIRFSSRPEHRGKAPTVHPAKLNKALRCKACQKRKNADLCIKISVLIWRPSTSMKKRTGSASTVPEPTAGAASTVFTSLWTITFLSAHGMTPDAMRSFYLNSRRL